VGGVFFFFFLLFFFFFFFFFWRPTLFHFLIFFFFFRFTPFSLFFFFLPFLFLKLRLHACSAGDPCRPVFQRAPCARAVARGRLCAARAHAGAECGQGAGCAGACGPRHGDGAARHCAGDGDGARPRGGGTQGEVGAAANPGCTYGMVMNDGGVCAVAVQLYDRGCFVF
jgi:hypothetical protein